MPVKIFVSYAEDDGSTLARRIRNYLTNQRFIVFVANEDIMVGEEWKTRIRKELESAHILIVILTQGAIISDTVRKEVEYAMCDNKRIIVAKDFYLNRSWQNIPWNLGSYQGIEFEGEDELKRKLAKSVAEVSQEVEQQSASQIQKLMDSMIYRLICSGINYDVPYRMSNGKLWAINVDSDFKSLVISIQSDDEGILELRLNRDLIDAKIDSQDDEFIVLTNDTGSEFEELANTSFYRTLSIPYKKDTKEIEVLGTIVNVVYLPKIVFDKEIYQTDDKMIVSIISLNSNSDPGVIETIEATISISTVTICTISFPETGPNTGIFERQIELEPAEGPVTKGLKLGVKSGDWITITFYFTPDTVSSKAVRVQQ